MKKIIFIAVLAFAASSAFAQVSVGGGYLNTNQTYTETKSDNTTSSETATLKGFYAGANYNIKLVGGLGIAPGIYYSYLTIKDVEAIDIEILTVDSDFTRRDHQISMPINLNYGLNLVPGILKLSLYAGPTLQYTVDSKTTGTVVASVGGINTNYNEVFDHIKGEGANYKPFDVMVGGGLAIDIVKMIRVEGGYNYGLLNRISSDNATLHNYGWHAGVAFIF